MISVHSNQNLRMTWLAAESLQVHTKLINVGNSGISNERGVSARKTNQ